MYGTLNINKKIIAQLTYNLQDESFEPIVHNWTIFVKYKRKCYIVHFTKKIGTKQGQGHNVGFGS